MIQESRKCKWVQFMHTNPEERGMFSGYPDANQARPLEVELAEKADLVVAVGAKLADFFRTSLRFCEKDQQVFVFTPGIFSEFSEVWHGSTDQRKCQILAFGSSDAEGFTSTGVRIAANAVACLDDVQLNFVVADEKQAVFVNNILMECNEPRIQRKVQTTTFKENLEDFKRIFSRYDLAIVPSEGGGYSVAALEAFSSGLPVLVNETSGFGEALKKVGSCSQAVIQSEDVEEWKRAIQNVWTKEKNKRLKESKEMLNNYDREYNWGNQCSDLVEKMKGIFNGRAFPSVHILASYIFPRLLAAFIIRWIMQREKNRIPQNKTIGKRDEGHARFVYPSINTIKKLVCRVSF